MPRVCLTVPGKNAQPYRFSLERKVVRLGRAADNDIVVDDPSVSARHCEMRRVEGGYILADLDSTNGIKLSGDPMEVIDLANDQEVHVGDALLEFQLSDEELDDLAREERSPQQRPKLPPLDASGEASEELEIKDEDSGEEKGDEPEEEDQPPAEDREPGKKKRPKPKRKPKRESEPSPEAEGETAEAREPSGIADFLTTVAFLILAALAFYLGLASKHFANDRGILFLTSPASEEAPENPE